MHKLYHHIIDNYDYIVGKMSSEEIEFINSININNDLEEDERIICAIQLFDIYVKYVPAWKRAWIFIKDLSKPQKC